MENSQPVVSADVAEAEFERICKKRRVRIDEAQMTDFEKQMFPRNKARFIACVMDGSLVVEDYDVIYHPQESPGFGPYKFGKLTGGTYLSTDKSEGGIHKAFDMLAQVTGKHASEFSKIDSYDFKNLKAVLDLFLD